MSARFPETIRIGTRGSPLALTQTRLFMAELAGVFPELKEEGRLSAVVIRASGDHDPTKNKDEPLTAIGGKGLFTKELEEALLAEKIDMAVHSMKDVPTWNPPGLVIAATLPRNDPRDAFLSPLAQGIDDLPQGAVFGTCSLRRQAQVLHRRPDLKVVPLRGNVETRLKKLDDGQMQAMMLAAAGLNRLGLSARITALLPADVVLPSPAQGIIGIQLRENDEALRAALSSLSHAPTFSMMQAERAMLQVLDGNCTTPIAALAQFDGDDLVLKGLVAHPAGTGLWRAEARGRDAVALGQEVGRYLRRQVPAGILPE